MTILNASNPTVSVIIATFNSEKYLELVLTALVEQSLDSSLVEVLLVDGGSNDATLLIASRFKCRIIENPRTEPVYAKYLGMLEARGKYVVYLDHDEVLTNPLSFEKRLDVISKNNVHFVLSSGYKNPLGFPFINQYINEFGEPFSFFMYRLSKDARFFLKCIRSRFKLHAENSKHASFELDASCSMPIIELCAAGSMIDREFLIENFPEVKKKPYLMPHYFYLLVTIDPILTISKNDSIDHYSAETLGRYLHKITWRIKNNVYFKNELGKAGYSGRSSYQTSAAKISQYLFIPYAFSLIFPILDAIYLSFTRRHIGYLCYPLLSLWTASSIAFHMALKLAGYRPQLKSYDGSTDINLDQ